MRNRHQNLATKWRREAANKAIIPYRLMGELVVCIVLHCTTVEPLIKDTIPLYKGHFLMYQPI